jgi:ABC-type multidrug transport system ATPase subunit
VANVSEKAALSVTNITVPGFLASVSFDRRVGEVMGCAGLVGSGRYELTRALFGLLRISVGEVEINGQPVPLTSSNDAIRYGIYMLPEKRKIEGIFPDLTVRENLLISAKRLFRRLSELLINANEEEKQYQGMRNSLDIRASSSGQKIIKLSGGNQQKVMLGRALMSNSRILLLNEPTRGVDVGTRVEIHAAIRKLAQSGYAIIVSSSDIPELVSVSDRCLVLSSGRMKGLLDRAQINEDNVTALAIGGQVLGIPMPIIILAVVALVASFIARETKLGRYAYALGGSEEAARRAGIPVRGFKVAIYAFCGCLVGIASIVLASRIHSAHPGVGLGYELDAIAAVVIGGASLAGGRGNASGAIIGALMIAAIRFGLNVMAVTPFIQQIVIGAILIIAVYLDRLRILQERKLDKLRAR